MIIWHFGEFHDLPSTAQRKCRWVQVGRRADGAILCREWSSSVETGCDLPTEVELILP